MKILYAVQGTGNGHVARARHLIPLIAAQPGVELEVWISGTESQVNLPIKAAKAFEGISLKYNRHGGLSYLKTLWQNRWIQFVSDVIKAPIKQYDLVVCDFEPVSAWAAKLRGARLLEVSHQAGVRHPKAPRPKQHNPIGEFILKHFAPSDQAIGFHAKSFAEGMYPPLIRKEIRDLPQNAQNQILVYLPAYGTEDLIAFFADCPVPVRAFVAKIDLARQEGSLRIEAVDSERFLQAFAESDSVLCSAGFELPTEALFHKKRLAVIPIKGQYEQLCNAAALVQVGAWQATSLHKLNLARWLHSPLPQVVPWPDFSEAVVEQIMKVARGGEL
jgi:uncharacterized protein (TIGR00661 family)